MRFGDYVAAQQADPVHYDQNDNEVMDSVDDTSSIRDEASNRQETLLFLEQQQSQDNWDTLGQPSGKYDYLVRYKGPENWKSFTEERSQIKATGWDDSVDPDDVPLGYNSDYEPQITDETDYPLLDNISGHIKIVEADQYAS